MHFNQRSYLVGQHARLSASKYHWINYDQDKLDRVFYAEEAARRGTELHQLAHDLIRLGQKLPTRPKTTLSMFVNDAIGFRMTPELVLYYSENVFGTTDAISFRRNLLRIADLKTGITPASEHQLEVYAALFCLEYKMRPMDIEIELRIYQNDVIQIFEADPIEIFRIMEKIKLFDARINELKMEVTP